MLAERYVAERLALVGEAAHVIHPIAGQGLNLGIRDAATLAELVIDRRRLGLDIGDPDLLGHYQRWRRLDTLALAAGDRWAQPPVLERVPTAAPRPRSRPRRGTPPPAAQAAPDARRNGARGRPAASIRPGRTVVIFSQPVSARRKNRGDRFNLSFSIMLITIQYEIVNRWFCLGYTRMRRSSAAPRLAAISRLQDPLRLDYGSQKGFSLAKLIEA